MDRRWTHRLFDCGIFFKGLDGLAEVIGGTALLVLSSARIAWLASFMTRGELSEDPGDIIANFLLHEGTSVTPHGKLVSVVFLLSHGLVKLFLVRALFMRKRWAYPLTMILLGVLIAYQTVEIARTGSPLLIALTLLDCAIVALTWQEYRLRKSGD